jgi:hypothetical protein
MSSRTWRRHSRALREPLQLMETSTRVAQQQISVSYHSLTVDLVSE